MFSERIIKQDGKYILLDTLENLRLGAALVTGILTNHFP